MLISTERNPWLDIALYFLRFSFPDQPKMMPALRKATSSGIKGNISDRVLNLLQNADSKKRLEEALADKNKRVVRVGNKVYVISERGAKETE